MGNPVPISSLFTGLNGLVALVLSYIVVIERSRTRIWHGASKEEVATQPNYPTAPNAWAALVENYMQKSIETKTIDDGMLQRKVRVFGNFTEYVPLALLFILTLELMQSQTWLLWLLGSALTIGRIAYAAGVIKTYGPSPGRAVGFFLTWFVYLVGAGACVYYGLVGIL